MGILPIGFFSPLPLAMMIPFMATQSLAMGEAFGKSFQYGKRKISSMTNEEFNKLTFRDLMVEQTANIKSLIPELKQQMAMSQDMQKAIFQEMIQLIPTFFESFKKAIPSDLTETSLASPPPAITEIIRPNMSQLKQNQLQQDNIQKALDFYNENFLKQRGTKESLAEKYHPFEQPVIRPPPTPPDASALLKAKSLREDTEWRAWSSKLSKLKATYNKLNRALNNPTSKDTNMWRQVGASDYPLREPAVQRRMLASIKSKKFSISTQIRAMSNDYRSPNNNIRQNALRLRANMGLYS